jgi:hypothetical protein
MRHSFMLTLLLLLSFKVVVNADRMFRFTFNDEIPPTPSVGCTFEDNILIDKIFNISNYVRTRQLSTSAPLEHDEHRRLNAYCRDNCEGYARGTCRATGCIGYRRELVDDKEGEIDQEHREATLVTCEAQKIVVHLALDTLIFNNKVTPACKTFMLKAKRKAECYDDVIYGEITSFTVWNTNIYRSPYTSNSMWWKIGEYVWDGFQVCNNIPMNIEAVLNPCVNYVNFTMTGPGVSYSRVDNGHPMLLFDTWVNRATFGGKYLSPGLYTVRARPDNFAYKDKQLQFRVIAC